MPTLHPAVLCVAYANVRTRRTASYIRAQLPEELIIGQHREACTIADIEAAEPFDTSRHSTCEPVQMCRAEGMPTERG